MRPSISFQTHKNRRGFTLIELLVSITIMILIVGVGLTSYLTFNERQRLAAGANELQTFLRGAQIRARSGDVPEGCGVLSGYNVKVAAGTNAIRTYAICDGLDVLQFRHDMPEGVIPEGGINIDFLTLHGGVTGAGDIILTNGTSTYIFTVTPGGEISKGDFDD